MSEQEDPCHKLSRYVRGLLMPTFHYFPPENVESAMDYNPKDGDFILVAYPKTGSTWLLHIIWKILHKAENMPDVHSVEVVENVGADAIDALPEPRFYKYHLPYNFIHKNYNSKYVYIHRNPEDTFVSYYYFLRELGYEDLDFDCFFEHFLKGEVPFGDFFDHVLSAYSHRQDKNLLLVSYEQLKQDTAKEIMRIAEFLGHEYHEILIRDSSRLHKILEDTSFENMKTNMKFQIRTEDGLSKEINFYRKGTFGDGKRHLSKDQACRLRGLMVEKMKGTEFVKLWSPKTDV